MNRSHHPPARRASPPGQAEPHPRQPQRQAPHPASWPGGLAGRFIQDIAAAASIAAGQNRAAPAATTPRRRTIAMPCLSPHTVQLCIHRRQNPAGFLVRRTRGMPTQRPWCLSCCQHQDPRRYHLVPFGGHGGGARRFR
jgi:hypothetical protein